MQARLDRAALIHQLGQLTGRLRNRRRPQYKLEEDPMLGLHQIFGKETIVGLDIGSRFIKVALAEASGSNGGWQIVKAAVAPTPHDSVRDGVIVDTAAMSQAIRDI